MSRSYQAADVYNATGDKALYDWVAELEECCRFLARSDYDWVEDWEEARDMASHALAARAALAKDSTKGGDDD